MTPYFFFFFLCFCRKSQVFDKFNLHLRDICLRNELPSMDVFLYIEGYQCCFLTLCIVYIFFKYIFMYLFICCTRGNGSTLCWSSMYPQNQSTLLYFLSLCDKTAAAPYLPLEETYWGASISVSSLCCKVYN